MSLLLAGAGSAALGVGLYGAAFGTHAAYDKAVTSGDAARIQSLHGTTNVLTLAGVGLLATGSGLVVAGVL